MRAVVGRVLFFGLLLACRLGLDGVEQLVQILPVIDEAHALVDAGEPGCPVGLPGAALDADVGHGLLLGEAAFHVGTTLAGTLKNPKRPLNGTKGMGLLSRSTKP